MQLYLFDAAGAKPAVHSHIQAFHRTIPINWCASGGSDTHHKITIATDLHAEISAKLRRSEHDLAQSKTDYHKEKIRAVVDTKHALGKVRTSAASRTVGCGKWLNRLCAVTGAGERSHEHQPFQSGSDSSPPQQQQGGASAGSGGRGYRRRDHATTAALLHRRGDGEDPQRYIVVCSYWLLCHNIKAKLKTVTRIVRTLAK
jgi:hypothetical protein